MTSVQEKQVLSTRAYPSVPSVHVSLCKCVFVTRANKNIAVISILK